MSRSRMLLCVPLAVVWIVALAPSQTAVPANAATEIEPAITQIRKSVTFVKLLCKDGDKTFDVRGTGFLVNYPDSRVGPNGGFSYLVTNRHVALCWNTAGHPMQVENISIRLNRLNAEGGIYSQESFINEHGNAQWVLPQDESVDLAVLAFLPDQKRFDFKLIPVGIFATSSLLLEKRITEGEPVLFAGFFQQFPGTKRMQPIVRQGIVAMMPDEKIPFVVTPEKLYLADVHVFGGNSGAPAFIDLGGIHGVSITGGEDYRLLGVVNGEVLEDEHFNLELATAYAGTAKANSGISTIVPADELKALLDDPRLQQQRENELKAMGLLKK